MTTNALIIQMGNNGPLYGEDMEAIGRAVERCIDAEEQIDSNASIPLCLEALAADLAELFALSKR